MQIKLLVSAAAIALAATIGWASAADQFSTLEGIAAQPLTALEMVAVHGANNPAVAGAPPSDIDIRDIFDGGFPPPLTFEIVFTGGSPGTVPTLTRE